MAKLMPNRELERRQLVKTGKIFPQAVPACEAALMPEFGGTQLRLAYSLLKPAVRVAAHFHIPVRTLIELVRLAYFELLTREGLTQAQIARRFGQTERHMRSLARRLRTDFFSAEQEIGIVREVENLVAKSRPSESELEQLLPSWSLPRLEEAVALLRREHRIEREPSGRLVPSSTYVLLSSEKFVHRVDALNHFLDAVYRATLARLVLDDREHAALKTVSFSALPAQLRAFIAKLEGDLRREIAALEENAAFEGSGSERYVLGLSLAAAGD